MTTAILPIEKIRTERWRLLAPVINSTGPEVQIYQPPKFSDTDHASDFQIQVRPPLPERDLLSDKTRRFLFDTFAQSITGWSAESLKFLMQPLNPLQIYPLMIFAQGIEDLPIEELLVNRTQSGQIEVKVFADRLSSDHANKFYTKVMEFLQFNKDMDVDFRLIELRGRPKSSLGY